MNSNIKTGVLLVKNLLNQFNHGNSVCPIDVTNDIHEAIRYMIANCRLNKYELSFLSKLHNLRYVSKFINTHDIKNETVMCFERDNLFNNVNLLERNPDRLVDYLNSNGIYKNRRDIEFDPKYVQIIPYMITRTHKGDYILLEKINGGDDRVLNKYDFPAGHVNYSKHDPFYDSIYREIEEELGIQKDNIEMIEVIGTIPVSNDKFSVSHYHLAVMVDILIKPDVVIENKESDKHRLVQYNDINNLDIIINGFENWITYALSKILLK